MKSENFTSAANKDEIQPPVDSMQDDISTVKRMRRDAACLSTTNPKSQKTIKPEEVEVLKLSKVFFLCSIACLRLAQSPK